MGDKDALQVPAGSDFAYGTGDFTIEAWVRPQGVTSGEAKGIFTQTQSGNEYVKFFINSDKTVKATFGSDTITGGTVEVGSWSHVAVTRASNTVKVFVNGVASSGTSVTTDFTDTTRKPTIGQYTHSFGTLEYYGYISNFRIVKGTAVYTTDFTPPTEKLTAIAGTVLLCCQDSDDPTQEATGKTITGYGGLSAAGTELLSNGNWSNGTTGWTATSGTWTASAGTVATSGEDIGLDQTVTTQIGAQYRVKYEIVTNYSNNQNGVYIRDGDGSAYVDTRKDNVTGRFEYVFTARESSHRIRLYNGGTSEIKFGTVSLSPINFTTPKDLPPVGVDEGVVFEGDTEVNSLGYMYFPTGDTSQRGRGRAVIGWANNPVNTGMDYFNVQSMGNSISFGSLTSGNRWGSHALSSSTRGLFVGGYINTPAATFYNTIDYVTIATASNPTDFGDVTTASYRSGCCSSSTRGVIALGYIAPNFTKSNTIDYVTIATTGNAADFGDTSQTRGNFASTSSPTRGVFAGGVTPSNVNTIDYVTIASTGNATNFGDLQVVVDSPMAMASTTRGIVGGGYPSPANTNTINYITMASAGDASDFGDLTGLYSVGSATSNSIRGVFCGGYTSPSKHNLMEFVTIASTGNASDFGDMLYSRRDFGAPSDSHGGLS